MPGLHLYTSNRLETLQEKMAARFKHHPLPPLQKEIIIVQSRGMERWLNLEIARQNGICAHVEYLFPKVFVYQLFRQVLDIPETTPYNPEINTWRILKLLPELMRQPDTDSIANYVHDDPSGRKHYQLSQKIAEAFDRYTIMRPEMVTAWDQGKNPLAADFRASRWQAALWQLFGAEAGIDLLPPHHAALKKVFLETPDPPLNLPARISVFGISTLPPYYIDVFQKIAGRIDVDIYYLDPCREYWEYAYSAKQIARFTASGVPEKDAYYDCGNSLLASMGSAGREFFSLVLNSIGDTGEDLFADPGDETLLTAIQSDILNLRQRRKGQGPPIADTDGSLRIHACHSRIREVEVLHDRLLDLLEMNRDLQVTDIIVMMPDVSAYAPLIQAVFDQPKQEGLRIPYSIADSHIRSGNAIADTFLRILVVGQKRFRAPAILDILETPAVRNKFGIDEQGLVRIKKWVSETGIRWGRDKSHREKLDLPGFHNNTWQFGLERMLLGYALPPEDDQPLFAGIFSYGEIEGDDARLLGAFTHFTQTLFKWVGHLQQRRPLAQWATQLEEMLTTFFVSDETSEGDLNQIRGTLTGEGLAGYASLTDFQDPVSLEVIQAYLEKRIGHEALSFGFMSSGVTFCTLLPMRSIPFQVVCMLGLNDGEYPRTGQVPGFDLMTRRRQLCDWSKRHEDRYLFLESLLSARQNLIISYIGCDPKDNSVRPPSPLVSELLDYIANGFKSAGESDLLDQVVTRHPLHPFSPHYFEGNDQLVSYSQPDCRAALASLESRRPVPGFPERPLPSPPAERWSLVTLQQFCRFFRNPAEFLGKNRLRVNFDPREVDLLEEREPFEIDPLQAYPIRNAIIEKGLSKGQTELLLQTLQASGRLPHGRPGELTLARLYQEASEFIEQIHAFSQAQPAKPFEINAVYGLENPICIEGYLGNLYPEGQLFYRCAELKGHDLLAAWIHHLILNTTDEPAFPKTTTIISKQAPVTLQVLSPGRARAELHKLVALFNLGLRSPLCFFAETSYAFAAAVVTSDKAVPEALAAARLKWNPGTHHTGEVDNIYIQRSFGLDMPSGRGFQDTALAIFKPVFTAMQV